MLGFAADVLWRVHEIDVFHVRSGCVLSVRGRNHGVVQYTLSFVYMLWSKFRARKEDLRQGPNCLLAAFASTKNIPVRGCEKNMS